METITKRGLKSAIIDELRLYGREDEIKWLSDLDVSKASIAKITGVDRSTLYNFIRSRKIDPNL